LSMEIDNEALEKYLFDENLPEDEITKRQWQIIDAAVKIFAEKGFDGSRTSDIAKEAEVAEGTIFRYYKTKKDLLIGLLFPLISKFFRPLMLMSVQKIMKNQDKRSLDAVLTDVFCDRIELVEKNLPLVKTILVESAYHPELLEPIRENIAPKIIPEIDRFFEDNIEKGKLRNLETRLITRTMMSSLIGYIVLAKGFPDLFGGGEDREEMKKIADILMHGIEKRES
jgi:AcrR family transcriptional regulator